MKRIFLFAVLLIIVSAVQAFAAGGPMAFLRNGSGARSAGFGNAGAGLGGDNESVIYNPAGLVLLSDLQLSFETNIMTFGRSMNFVSAGKPFAIGSNIYSTAISWIGYSAGSDLQLRKTNSPEPDGSFADSSNVFILSSATTVSQRLFVGVNFRVFLENLYTARATGIGFDAGILGKPVKELGLGLTFYNIGASLGWSNNGKPEAMPLLISFGASYMFSASASTYILPLIDIMLDDSGQFYVKGGVESYMFNFLSLRAGYDNAFSMGAGLNLKTSKVFNIKFNYGMRFDPIVTGGMNHRIGAVIDYVFPHKGVDSTEAAAEKKPDAKAEPEVLPAKKKVNGVSGYDW